MWRLLAAGRCGQLWTSLVLGLCALDLVSTCCEQVSSFHGRNTEGIGRVVVSLLVSWAKSCGNWLRDTERLGSGQPDSEQSKGPSGPRANTGLLMSRLSPGPS